MLPADLREWLATEGARQGLTMASFVRRELLVLRRELLAQLELEQSAA